jgi:hypothetical protein
MDLGSEALAAEQVDGSGDVWSAKELVESLVKVARNDRW